MLRHLDIRNLLIIDRLELEFQPGLNVLTGETGAGKSILLDSLGFVLGWRGRAELVREGADQGEVTAVFDLPMDHAAAPILDEAGFEFDGELILRRVNARDGRKTAWINDRRASGDVLRRVSETLVELHGQHDDRGLLNPRGHRQMLDHFAGVDLAPVGKAWTAQRQAREALAAAKAKLDDIKDEEEFLRFSVDELQKLAPEVGEEAALDTKRRLMQAATRIREDVARAATGLGPQGAEGMVSDAMRWLDGAAGEVDGALDPALDALNRAMIELGEAQAGVDSALDAMAFNPSDLEDAEERLFAIRAMARKHNVQPDELAGLAQDLTARLQSLDAGAADIATLQTALTAAETAYAEKAALATKARIKAAKSFDAAVMGELAPLKMERAVFETQITTAEPGPEGQDAVSFTVATNPGARPGPLAKIASGGELSRFLLALKVCLSGSDGGATMIFDEIDRGVGGATANAVGRRLRDLAEGGQVLVVTHSPQVAALGAHHWRVAKNVKEGQTTSTVAALAAPDRIDEVARMLSGDTITDAARDAARALLSD